MAGLSKIHPLSQTVRSRAEQSRKESTRGEGSKGRSEWLLEGAIQKHAKKTVTRQFRPGNVPGKVSAYHEAEWQGMRGPRHLQGTDSSEELGCCSFPVLRMHGATSRNFLCGI